MRSSVVGLIGRDIIHIHMAIHTVVNYSILATWIGSQLLSSTRHCTCIGCYTPMYMQRESLPVIHDSCSVNAGARYALHGPCRPPTDHVCVLIDGSSVRPVGGRQTQCWVLDNNWIAIDGLLDRVGAIIDSVVTVGGRTCNAESSRCRA